MKSMIYADFVILKQSLKAIGLVYLFFVLFAVSTKNISFLSTSLVMICVMVPLSLMSYDKTSGWDKMALALPVTRRDVVASKYAVVALFTLVVLLLSAGLMMIVHLVSDGSELLIPYLCSLLVCAGVVLLLAAVILPLSYQFGVEKSRYIFLAIVWAPILLSFILSNSGSSNDSGITNPLEHFFSLLDQMLPMQLFFASLVILLACLIVYAVSIPISVQIYRKKEL